MYLSPRISYPSCYTSIFFFLSGSLVVGAHTFYLMRRAKLTGTEYFVSSCAFSKFYSFYFVFGHVVEDELIFHPCLKASSVVFGQNRSPTHELTLL